jgi:hypothetical protein
MIRADLRMTIDVAFVGHAFKIGDAVAFYFYVRVDKRLPWLVISGCIGLIRSQSWGAIQ